MPTAQKDGICRQMSQDVPKTSQGVRSRRADGAHPRPESPVLAGISAVRGHPQHFLCVECMPAVVRGRVAGGSGGAVDLADAGRRVRDRRSGGGAAPLSSRAGSSSRTDA